MPVKTPARIEAERLCSMFPDAPSRTLAKRLSDSHHSTVENARKMITTVRGVNGDANRASTTSKEMYREKGHSGWKPDMPPSQAKPWTPFVVSGCKNVAVISDIHVPFHSRIALESAVSNCLKRKPDTLLINGDAADFYAISRHQKNPAKTRFKRDRRLFEQLLAWLREMFGSNCRIILKKGNHEERWDHYLWNHAPEICDDPRMRLERWINSSKYGVEVVGDQRPVMIGKLPVFHGHEFGKYLMAPVNPARGAFMRLGSTGMIGHLHQTSQHVQPDWRHIQTACWSLGCLCDLNPDYAKINRWNWGAANIEVADRGEYSVDNFRVGPNGEVWK